MTMEKNGLYRLSAHAAGRQRVVERLAHHANQPHTAVPGQLQRHNAERQQRCRDVTGESDQIDGEYEGDTPAHVADETHRFRQIRLPCNDCKEDQTGKQEPPSQKAHFSLSGCGDTPSGQAEKQGCRKG